MDDVIIGQPENLVFTIDESRLIADSLFAAVPVAPAAGVLHGYKVKPFVNDVTPTKDKVLADFTPPVTAGLSTAVAPVAGAAFESSDGSAEVVSGLCQFTASALPAAEETIYGVIWTDSAGAVLLAAERFTTSVKVAANGRGFGYVPRYAHPRI